jgi:hypothetical protein
MTQRRVQIALLAAVALSGCGCQSMRSWFHKDPYSEKAPSTYKSELTCEELVAHINHNISRCGSCGSWQCDRVKVKMTGIPAPLPATLAVRAPHSLRMRVQNPITGGDALDLGSNDEYFWMWMRDGQASPVMMVRHEEFDLVAKASPMPIPFHPDWLMEVLGVVQLNPAEYELVKPSGNQPFVDLVATRTAPDGEKVQRILRVNPRHGLIVEHRLQKLNGELLGKASLSGYFQDPVSHAVVPRVITVEAAVEGRPMSLTLTFDNPEINSATLATADHLWMVPEIPGSPQVDMCQMLRSRGLIPPQGGPRVQGTSFPRIERIEEEDETSEPSPGVKEIAHEEPPRDRPNPWAKSGLVPIPEPDEDEGAVRLQPIEEPLEPIGRQVRSRTIVQ